MDTPDDDAWLAFTPQRLAAPTTTPTTTTTTTTTTAAAAGNASSSDAPQSAFSAAVADLPFLSNNTSEPLPRPPPSGAARSAASPGPLALPSSPTPTGRPPSRFLHTPIALDGPEAAPAVATFVSPFPARSAAPPRLSAASFLDAALLSMEPPPRRLDAVSAPVFPENAPAYIAASRSGTSVTLASSASARASLGMPRRAPLGSFPAATATGLATDASFLAENRYLASENDDPLATPAPADLFPPRSASLASAPLSSAAPATLFAPRTSAASLRAARLAPRPTTTHSSGPTPYRDPSRPRAWDWKDRAPLTNPPSPSSLPLSYAPSAPPPGATARAAHTARTRPVDLFTMDGVRFLVAECDAHTSAIGLRTGERPPPASPAAATAAPSSALSSPSAPSTSAPSPPPPRSLPPSLSRHAVDRYVASALAPSAVSPPPSASASSPLPPLPSPPAHPSDVPPPSSSRPPSPPLLLSPSSASLPPTPTAATTPIPRLAPSPASIASSLPLAHLMDRLRARRDPPELLSAFGVELAQRIEAERHRPLPQPPSPSTSFTTPARRPARRPAPVLNDAVPDLDYIPLAPAERSHPRPPRRLSTPDISLIHPSLDDSLPSFLDHTRNYTATHAPNATRIDRLMDSFYEIAARASP